VAGLVADVVERFGRLDVVVSNAAGYETGPVTELADDACERLRATNVDAFLPRQGRAAAPGVGRWQPRRRLLGLRRPRRPGAGAYNATKAAISNFVRSLALDWGGAGVRLNAVAPAFTLTELTEGVGRDDESPAPHVNRIALGRPGEPADVAPVVLFAGQRRRALRDRRRDAGRRRDERLDRAAARQTPMAALRRVVR
jgi:meso-butanediol dehydrogenase/(S,S)-butanediol dehydrogenase/diacetyl reductase